MAQNLKLRQFSHEEIMIQLQRILANLDFHASPQQRAFLKFVVDQTLAGNEGEIKGYTVATEVFGRGSDFDQNIDPVVSIHAGKLRRALERYYLTAGKNDPIRINIPKGTYVPTFSEHADAESDAAVSGNLSDKDIEDSWPSVLIMPFKNLTGDPEKDFLVVGLST